MMRRAIALVSGAVLLGGVALAGPAVAADTTPMPPVQSLTLIQFTQQYKAQAAAFAAQFNGSVAFAATQEMDSAREGKSSFSLTVNPDGSYVLNESDSRSGDKETTMCFAYVEGSRECYVMKSENGLWLRYDTSYDNADIAAASTEVNELTNGVIGETVDEVNRSAKIAGATPVYTVTNTEGVNVFTASYSTATGGRAATFSFPDGKMNLADVDNEGDTTIIQLSSSELVNVYRPAKDELDWSAAVKSDINALAKSLETYYTDFNMYPKRVVKSSVTAGTTLKVCYNAKGKKATHYTLMGSFDGGKTYYVYHSDRGGLQEGVVTSKTNSFPACGTLKTREYDSKKWHPMVDGPKVASYK